MSSEKLVGEIDNCTFLLWILNNVAGNALSKRVHAVNYPTN